MIPETDDPPPTEPEIAAAPSARIRSGLLIISVAIVTLLMVGVGVASLVRTKSATISPTETTANFAVLDANATETEGSTALDVTDTNTADMNASSDALPTPPAAWDYFDTYDQVRGSAIYRASLESENAAYFDFPYQGGSTLRMTVRKHPQYGDDVIFKISKGQFVCGADDCSGTINFGSGPKRIPLSEPTDNSSDTLFVSNSGEIIEQLKKAKRVVVELPFYQEGNRQFTFVAKVALAWPPKGSESQELVDENGMSISDD